MKDLQIKINNQFNYHTTLTTIEEGHHTLNIYYMDDKQRLEYTYVSPLYSIHKWDDNDKYLIYKNDITNKFVTRQSTIINALLTHY